MRGLTCRRRVSAATLSGYGPLGLPLGLSFRQLLTLVTESAPPGQRNLYLGPAL